MADPTPKALAQALVARFARGKPEDVDLSLHAWYVREITTALTAQAQAHPECHPAALCDGPEQAREIERLNQVDRLHVRFEQEQAREITRLRAALRDVMAWGVELDDERLGYVSVQVDRGAIAAARAAAQGGTR